MTDQAINNEAQAGEAAAPGGMLQIPPEIAAIIERLHTQDNRSTDNPLFAVQQKRRIYGVDPDRCDNIVWLDEANDYGEASAEEFAQMEAAHNNGDSDLSNWHRTGYIDAWEFVTGCFTEQGCKDYIACNGHNLEEPRIYAYGSYRNDEFIALRKWLMSLSEAVSDEPLPSLPQVLIDRIGEYGMARTDGVSDVERLHRWELVIDGIKDYARALLSSAPLAMQQIHDRAAGAAPLESRLGGGTQPAGWKLVPLEPTGVMKDVGASALPMSAANTWHAADAYRAMLAASPAAPGGLTQEADAVVGNAALRCARPGCNNPTAGPVLAFCNIHNAPPVPYA
jgi:hypothetical protein